MALAVDPNTGQSLTTDQRGAGYPRVVKNAVDIGAFEVQPPQVTATQLVVTTQPPANVTQGQVFTVVIEAEDGSGDLATSFSGSVAVALANNPSSATLGGTLTATAANGVATFSDLTLSQPGNGDTLRFSSSGLTSSTTTSFNVTSSAATKLAVTTQPGSVSVGTAFGLVVTVEDAAGDTAASFDGSVTVALANNPSGAALGGTLTATASNGVATFSGFTLNSVGIGVTLQVTSTGLTAATTSPFNVTPDLTVIPIPDKVDLPQAITAGPDGNLWFSLGPNLIASYNPTTQSFSQEYRTPSSGGISAMTAGPDGNIWFTEDISEKVGMINPTTHLITEYALLTSSASPTGIVSGPEGQLWFTESGADKIGTINPTSGAITEFTLPTAGAEPSAIAFGADGNLWFTEPGVGQIGMFDPSTHTFSAYPPSGGLSLLGGIATGSDLNLWFTEQNKVGSINPGSHAINEYSVPGASGLRHDRQWTGWQPLVYRLLR